MKSNLFRVVSALLAFFPIFALEAQGEGSWSPEFALPGASQNVYCSIEFGGNLIVGGDFEFINLQHAMRVASWNGSSWTSMGEGFDGPVRALAVHNGELYAGGDFNYSGTSYVSGVARWDGTAWQPLDELIYYYSIRSILSYEGDLIVGGIADWDSDMYHYYELAGLAKWSNGHWSSLAEFEWGWEGCVYGLGVHEGDLVIAGTFEGVDGDWDIRYVARWEYWHWVQFGDLYSPDKLVTIDDELYASANGIYHWTGTDWGLIGETFDGWVYDFTEYNGGIAACGDFDMGGHHGTAYWDGETWAPIGGSFGNPGNLAAPSLYTLSPYSGSLVAGGSFRDVEGTAILRLAGWDGDSWGPLANPADFSSFNGVDRGPYGMGRYRNQVAIGGPFDNSHGSVLNGVGIWTGEEWQSLGSGITDRWDFLRDLEEYEGALVAGGDFLEIDGVYSPCLSIWDGTQWQAFSEGMPYNCWELLANGSDLYVANESPSKIVHWDGSAWSDLNGGLNENVYAMAIYDGTLVVGGAFTEDAHGKEMSYVARWNGSSWEALGSGFDNSVSALHVFDGDLVAGGRFSTAGGTLTEYLAVWNGESWVDFPGQPNNQVYCIEVFQGDLIIGGYFDSIDGTEVNGISRWDGSQWLSLDKGFSNRTYNSSSYVYDLQAIDDQLYACGVFAQAGNNPSYGIACWSEVAVDIASGEYPIRHLISRSYPNPLNPSTQIQFDLPQDSRVSIRILDSQGAVVRRLLNDELLSAGVRRVTWNGGDDKGNPLPSGMYYYEIETSDGRATGKMTVLK